MNYKPRQKRGFFVYYHYWRAFFNLVQDGSLSAFAGMTYRTARTLRLRSG